MITRAQTSMTTKRKPATKMLAKAYKAKGGGYKS